MAAKLITGMTVSLDGFVEDRNGSGAALYTDFAELRDSTYLAELVAETGAVLMGRRTFAMGEGESWDDYEFQVPIFVVTSEPPAAPPKENADLTFTFVTDGLDSAVRQARAAAGDRAVTVVGGIETIRALLLAGHVDELQLDVMPVLLGEGVRLLDDPGLAHVRLAKLGVHEAGVRTSLRFRVLR